MQDMYDLNVLHVDRNRVQPGDIVFITSDSNRISHGGLFVKWLGRDEFSFVDASSYYGKVVADSFPVSGYVRGQWLVGFGRLLQRRHHQSTWTANKFIRPNRHGRLLLQDGFLAWLGRLLCRLHFSWSRMRLLAPHIFPVALIVYKSFDQRIVHLAKALLQFRPSQGC